MTKREAIVELLEHHDDFAGPGVSHNGYGAGDRVPMQAHAKDCRVYASLRCSCWRRSLAELERSLAELRAAAVVHHAHLVARYHRAERARRVVRLRNGAWMTDPNERVVIPDFDPKRTSGAKNGSYDTLTVRWPQWVDLLIVAQALDQLEQLYRGEPYLPVEALAA